MLGASQKGYEYLAISEVIIEESWALLDYLLILELIRRCQQHLHEHFTLGHAFVRGTLERLNRHRKVNENTRDNEFQIFFDFYKADLFRFDRSLLERDPYDLADEIYDEEQERTGLHEHLHSTWDGSLTAAQKIAHHNEVLGGWFARVVPASQVWA